MKKRYRNMQKKANGKVREIGDGSVLLELPLSVAGVIESLPEVIRELAQEAGLLLMSAAMDSECERIAGSKDSNNPLTRLSFLPAGRGTKCAINKDYVCISNFNYF